MLTIGKLAKQADISIDTLRFYDKQGLLTPSRRSDAGYRLYGDEDLQRLNFILKAKRLGFSLEAIQELLSIRVEKNLHSCGEVKTLCERHLDDIAIKIAELQQLQLSLQLLNDACIGGPETAENCSILAGLEHSDLFDNGGNRDD